MISPNTKPSVIRETRRLGMISVPGALTPSEICNAWDEGADIVKLFPADDAGFHYIQNLKGPLPHVPLMATGGVNPNTIPQFLSAGISAVGTGVTVLKKDLIATEDYEAIQDLARMHMDAIRLWQKEKFETTWKTQTEMRVQEISHREDGEKPKSRREALGHAVIHKNIPTMTQKRQAL